MSGRIIHKLKRNDEGDFEVPQVADVIEGLFVKGLVSKITIRTLKTKTVEKFENNLLDNLNEELWLFQNFPLVSIPFDRIKIRAKPAVYDDIEVYILGRQLLKAERNSLITNNNKKIQIGNGVSMWVRDGMMWPKENDD